MQPALFDDTPKPRVRKTDPIQSVSAARRAEDRLPSRRVRIMEALDYQPLTDDEICKVLGEHPRWWPSVKTARSGLKNDKLLVGTGYERHGQQVWRRADRQDHARIDPTQPL